MDQAQRLQLQRCQRRIHRRARFVVRPSHDRLEANFRTPDISRLGAFQRRRRSPEKRQAALHTCSDSNRSRWGSRWECLCRQSRQIFLPKVADSAPSIRRLHLECQTERSLPFWTALGADGYPGSKWYRVFQGIQYNPYANTTQSTNLRVISSELNPTYRAKNDTRGVQRRLQCHAVTELYVADRLQSGFPVVRQKIMTGLLPTPVAYLALEFWGLASMLDNNVFATRNWAAATGWRQKI